MDAMDERTPHDDAPPGRAPRGTPAGGVSDRAFVDDVADRLAALTGVRAVALGGSRAWGTHRPDSDWDLAVYYRGGGGDRGGFDPEELRAVGWEGEVSTIGAWGGGVFNGGAWLSVHGRRVDVHYRDLGVVEHELAEAERGRFHWEPLMFHLAGIPSYLVVAELAGNRVLRGELPRPDGYPEPLRRSAAAFWREGALMTLTYAEHNHAPRARRTEVAGALASAAMQTAHAVLAARGEWVTNEKRLLERAGLDAAVDGLLPPPAASAAALTALVARARTVCEAATRA